MTPRNARRFAVVLIVLLLALSPFVRPAQAVTDEDVSRTIDKLIEALLEMQDEPTPKEKPGQLNPAGWENGDKRGDSDIKKCYPAGRAALVLTALSYAGVSRQHPAMQRGLKFIDQYADAPINDSLDPYMLRGTYQVGLMAHAYAHTAPPNSEMMRRLEKCGRWLESAGNTDRLYNYAYVANPTSSVGIGLNLRGFDHGWKESKNNTQYDLSNSQYAWLGMWECAKRGYNLNIRRDYWLTLIRTLKEKQNEDGSFGYRDNGGHTDTMTLAGITGALVAQQEAFRGRSTPDQAVAQMIEKALDWHNKRGRGSQSGGYYLVSVERVALGLGFKYFQGKDWFSTGAAEIVKKYKGKIDTAKKKDDRAVAELAFHLMFLARGHVPVWCTKIQVPNMAWNNRPNDIYFLSQALSDLREGEVNWQVIDLSRDTAAMDMQTAPVAYLSTAEQLEFSSNQLDTLREYIELGGLLIINPDERSSAVTASIDGFVKKLFPNLKPTNMPADHPLGTALHDIRNQLGNIKVVNNGARDLIYMFETDYGFKWQSDPDLMNTPAGEVAANIFAMATNRGVLPNRLESRFEFRDRKQKERGKLSVLRPLPAGVARPVEPRVWEPVGNFTFNRTGIDVVADKSGIIPLADLGDAQQPLAHLTGVDPIKLEPEEVDAIHRYTDRGGVLLIETVGGSGGFARDVLLQIGGRARQVSKMDAIISGDGLDGGIDCKRVNFRRYTQVKMKYDPEARFRIIRDVESKPSIIISDEDLSLGALGVLKWDVWGYTPASSRQLLHNIAMYAKSRKMDE